MPPLLRHKLPLLAGAVIALCILGPSGYCQKVLTAGLRFNEPLPLQFHNSMSLGYVNQIANPTFLTIGVAAPAPALKNEHAVEFNALLDVLPMVLLQPVVQYYTNMGRGSARAVVVGFRTKIDL